MRVFHRKCYALVTIGLFLCLGSLATMSYFSECKETLNELQSVCDAANPTVCRICRQCSNETICSARDIDLYCGTDCDSIRDRLHRIMCPSDVNVVIVMVVLFLCLALAFGASTALYVFQEICQELTGTQDDVDPTTS